MVHGWSKKGKNLLYGRMWCPHKVGTRTMGSVEPSPRRRRSRGGWLPTADALRSFLLVRRVNRVGGDGNKQRSFLPRELPPELKSCCSLLCMQDPRRRLPPLCLSAFRSNKQEQETFLSAKGLFSPVFQPMSGQSLLSIRPEPTLIHRTIMTAAF